MGWMGSYHLLKYTLHTFGVDFQGEDPLLAIADERGVHEPAPAAGLSFFMNIKSDDNDVVVADNVIAFINGKPASPVQAYMNSTSYGVRNIKVY